MSLAKTRGVLSFTPLQSYWHPRRKLLISKSVVVLARDSAPQIQ
jgi:hypothetical protein